MGLRIPQQQQEPLPEYDAIRRRAQQKQMQEAQQAREGVERNFARFGGTNTGAFIKTQQNVQNEISRQGEDVNSQINEQELGERRRIRELESGKDFARSEREAGQKFAAEQQAGQYAFGKSEREAGQSFAAQQQAGQYAFGKSEREAGQAFQREQGDKDLAFRDKVFSLEKESKLRQLDLADKEFASDQRTTEFNKLISVMGLGEHGKIANGLRSVIEDQNSSPAAREAAKQYLGGINSYYLSSEQQRTLTSMGQNRQRDLLQDQYIRENKAKGLI